MFTENSTWYYTDCDGLKFLLLHVSTLVLVFPWQVKSEIKTDMCHSYVVFILHQELVLCLMSVERTIIVQPIVTIILLLVETKTKPSQPCYYYLQYEAPTSINIIPYQELTVFNVQHTYFRILHHKKSFFV